MSDPGPLLDALRTALARDYKVEEFLGRGRLGLVFRAVERDPRRVVALRALPLGAPAGLGERLRREARVAANLEHPNVVPVFRVGQAAGTDFYTMRFVEGTTLDRAMAARGRLSIPAALAVLQSVARGLMFAHSRRVIHRDLKGASVFVDTAGVVAIADPGIARALEDPNNAAAFGAPHFLSPEHFSGRAIGPEADQYALGILAYQVLSGRLPFDAASSEALGRLHVSAPVPDVGVARAGVPQELVDVVFRLLAKAPSDRFATTRDLHLALEAVPATEESRASALEELKELAVAPVTAGSVPAAAPVAAAAPPPEPEPELEAPPAPEMIVPPAELEVAAPAAAPPAPPPPPPAKRPTPRPIEVVEEQPLVFEHGTPPPEPEPVVADVEAPAPTEPEPVPEAQPVHDAVAEPALAEEPPAAEAEVAAPAEAAPTTVPRVSGPPALSELLQPEPRQPRRRLPVVPVVGVVAVLAVIVAAVMLRSGRRQAHEQRANLAADSAHAAAVAAPPVRPAPADTPASGPTGFVRVRGDLPVDAIIWLDGKRMPGRVFAATPGLHTLEIETEEFKVWDQQITIRLADTLRVLVELELLESSDSTP